MKRLLAAFALFTLALLALGTTVASAQTVTIGNTFSSALFCNQAVVVQTANSAYVVPAGNWRVTSWSTQAGPAGGSMSSSARAAWAASTAGPIPRARRWPSRS